jgi:hypothetical protein
LVVMMIELDEVEWWSFDLVREALTVASGLWWRTPGEARRAFATDGPWHLMQRELAAGDYDARGGFDQSSDEALRPLPLGREEVAFRDRVSEWLGLIEQPDDRVLVILAAGYYARGYRQVPWRKVKHRLRVPRGEAGLRKRFERAVRAVAEALNAQKMGDAK